MRKIVSVALVAFAALALSACAFQPTETGAQADGLVIYSGATAEMLNGRTVEIVTNRVQQLRASISSGHTVVWHSSNPNAVSVDSESGRVRVGLSPNQTARITVTSLADPSITAWVDFRTRGLR